MKAIIVTLIAALLLGPWTTGTGAVQQDGNKQIPLDHPIEQTGRRQEQPGKYTINEPGENVCQAGARQWAGKVNVSEGNAMFYWFFESRTQPKNDPILVWIDGGPGISSMMGMFLQAGPCSIQQGDNATNLNPHSWTNFASVIFIDNPSGVGFSTSDSGRPVTMEDAGNDINAFLRIFFSDMFPQFSTNTVHFVGESMGGHWVPNFVTHISKRQQLNVPGTFNGAVNSIILLNAVISQTTSGDGASYDHFCSPESRIKFNQTACRAMEETTPECDYLSRQCVDTYDANICRAAFNYCANVHARWYNEYGPDQPDPYDDRFVCDPESFACGNFDMSFVDYLNTGDVKKRLGIAPAFKYKVYNSTINRVWGERGPMAVPTTRELSFILDQTPTRVLVVNGNNDIIVETSGQKRIFDALVPWKGQAAYRLRRFTDWSWIKRGSVGVRGDVIKGGQLKSAGKLAFVSVDDAGHLPSLSQPEAVSSIVKCWVTGMSDGACPRL